MRTQGNHIFRQPTLLRLLSLSILLAYSIIVTAAALAAARSGMDVALDGHGIQGWFRASQRVLLPGQCATLSWQAENAASLQLDGQTVEAQGSLEVCTTQPFFRELQAVAPDGNVVKATVYVGMFPYGRTVTASLLGAHLGFVALTVFVGIMGDLPGISPTLRRNRAAFRRYADFTLAKLRPYWQPLENLGEIRYILFASLTCAVGLIGLRAAPWAHNAVVTLAAVGLGAAGCAVWIRAAQTDRPAAGQISPTDRGMLLLIGSAIVVITVLAYLLPMRAHVWMGGDEAYVLNKATLGWSVILQYDLILARPLTPLGALIGSMFSLPTGIDGFLLWATIARAASALLFVGIVRLLLPKSWIIPFAAGLLFIVNPSEPTRFAAIHMQGYHMLLLLMLLAIFLFLLAYRRASRPLLIASMVALGAACLIVEVAFIMALVMPLTLYLWGGDRRRSIIWSFTWFVTLVLFAFRLFVRTGEVDYQLVVLQEVPLEEMIRNISVQLTPLFGFFRLADATPWQWLIAIALGILSTLTLLFAARRSEPISRRTLVTMLVVSLLYICLTVGVFIRLTGVLAQIRTQFAPSPGQALFWVLLLALLATRFTSRRANAVVALMVGVMITLSTANGFSDETRTTFATPNTRYEAVVRTIHDVRAVSPQYNSESVIVFYLEAGAETPLGWGYMLIELSQYLFGTRGVVVNYEGLDNLIFRLNDERSRYFGLPVLTADRLVAFCLASDGSATLLETLPDTGDFTPRELRQYDPESHFRAETTPHPLLRFFLPEPEGRPRVCSIDA